MNTGECSRHAYGAQAAHPGATSDPMMLLGAFFFLVVPAFCCRSSASATAGRAAGVGRSSTAAVARTQYRRTWSRDQGVVRAGGVSVRTDRRGVPLTISTAVSVDDRGRGATQRR